MRSQSQDCLPRARSPSCWRLAAMAWWTCPPWQRWHWRTWICSPPFRNGVKVSLLRLLKGWASRKQFSLVFKQLVVAVATELEVKIQLSGVEEERTDDNDEASIQAYCYCAQSRCIRRKTPEIQ